MSKLTFIIHFFHWYSSSRTFTVSSVQQHIGQLKFFIRDPAIVGTFHCLQGANSFFLFFLNLHSWT